MAEMSFPIGGCWELRVGPDCTRKDDVWALAPLTTAWEYEPANGPEEPRANAEEDATGAGAAEVD
jgi:hypothetical protein